MWVFSLRELTGSPSIAVTHTGAWMRHGRSCQAAPPLGWKHMWLLWSPVRLCWDVLLVQLSWWVETCTLLVSSVLHVGYKVQEKGELEEGEGEEDFKAGDCRCLTVRFSLSTPSSLRKCFFFVPLLLSPSLQSFI